MKKHGNQIRQTLLIPPNIREILEKERIKTGASLSEVARRYLEEGIESVDIKLANVRK